MSPYHFSHSVSRPHSPLTHIYPGNQGPPHGQIQRLVPSPHLPSPVSHLPQLLPWRPKPHQPLLLLLPHKLMADSSLPLVLLYVGCPGPTPGFFAAPAPALPSKNSFRHLCAKDQSSHLNSNYPWNNRFVCLQISLP
jgi:hypothetical protein